jgi:uncharacterized OB-fold protein
MAEDTRSPLVTNNPETLPFWEAAAEGRFIVRYCLFCNRAHWYPRAICPFCFSDKTEWKQASGNGTVYSYSVMRRVPEPYAIAYVTLEEGPKMLTNLVKCDFDAIRIGQRVKVVFKPSSEGMQLPMFTPA